MNSFFRFPHTPHIAWLGKGIPRDDKVLAPDEVKELLSGSVLVEEKVDGANLGISLGDDDSLCLQNRGQYLSEPYLGQFSRLTDWLAQHQWTLTEKLPPDVILFGEWCAAKHSLNYDGLPDWFMVFDVYDRREQKFWNTARRNRLATELGLKSVQSLFEGETSPAELKILLENSSSRYRTGPPEGLVIRRESENWCENRAKLVRSEFIQTIGEHWRNRVIEWNRVALEPEQD